MRHWHLPTAEMWRYSWYLQILENDFRFPHPWCSCYGWNNWELNISFSRAIRRIPMQHNRITAYSRGTSFSSVLDNIGHWRERTFAMAINRGSLQRTIFKYIINQVPYLRSFQRSLDRREPVSSQLNEKNSNVSLLKASYSYVWLSTRPGHNLMQQVWVKNIIKWCIQHFKHTSLQPSWEGEGGKKNEVSK